MSSAHLHLMLNHFPLFGLLFGGGLLLYARIQLSDTADRIALVFFVIGALGAGGAYLTGEGAEEIVEGQPGVLHSAIETHEEIAVYALIASSALAVLSLIVLFWYRHRSIPRAVNTTLLVLAIGAFLAVAYTAYTGGKVNHPELRSGPPETNDAAVSPTERDEQWRQSRYLLSPQQPSSGTRSIQV